MGGSLNVIVREKDGKVTKMCRGTNSLMNYFHNPLFLTDPDKLLKQYIKDVTKSDYHHGSVKIAPDDYGLIVIDAVNNLILSHQGYISLDFTTGATFYIDMSLRETLDFSLKNNPIPYINLKTFENKEINKHEKMIMLLGGNSPEEDISSARRLYELFMLGAVKGCPKILKNLEDKNPKTKKARDEIEKYKQMLIRLKGKKRTKEDWKFFLKYITGKDNLSFFKVTLGKYKIMNMEQSDSDSRGLEEFQEKLIELGFNLTKADQKAWKEFQK